jgi:hypothetical protein
VDARLTADTLEVLHCGVRVASHVRSYEAGKATTLPEHRPKAHQKYQRLRLGKVIRMDRSLPTLAIRLHEGKSCVFAPTPMNKLENILSNAASVSTTIRSLIAPSADVLGIVLAPAILAQTAADAANRSAFNTASGAKVTAPVEDKSIRPFHARRSGDTTKRGDSKPKVLIIDFDVPMKSADSDVVLARLQHTSGAAAPCVSPLGGETKPDRMSPPPRRLSS